MELCHDVQGINDEHELSKLVFSVFCFFFFGPDQVSYSGGSSSFSCPQLGVALFIYGVAREKKTHFLFCFIIFMLVNITNIKDRIFH